MSIRVLFCAFDAHNVGGLEVAFDEMQRDFAEGQQDKGAHKENLSQSAD